MITYYENRDLPFDCHPAENLTYLLHLHKQLELVYVLQGTIQVQVDDHSRIMQEQELAVIFPNSIHSYESIGESNVLLMIFDTDLVSDLADPLMKQLPQSPFLTQEQVHPDILYLLPYFLRYNQEPLGKKLLKGYLTVIVSRLLEQLSLIDSVPNRNTDLVHRTLYYLNQHFTEPLSLGQVARQLGFSKYYLSRCFSENTGCNFNQYINSLRIGYAKQLLETSSLSVTEIATTSGFESQCTFYRAFHEQIGLTPKQYRTRARKSEPLARDAD